MAGTNTSRSIILAMLNNMLGGGLLTLPLIFRTSGIISSTIIMLIISYIQFATCRIYVIHAKDNQKTIQVVLRRILGVKGQNFYRLMTGIYMILVSMIYLDLLVDQFYSIVYDITYFIGTSDKLARKDQLIFNKFSQQWLSLILFFPLFLIVSIKNMKFLVKICQYGSFSIFVYMGYVIIQFFVTAVRGDISTKGISWFSMDIGNLAGNVALSLVIHPLVNAFVYQNKDQSKNQRDVGITYILGFCIYEIVSVMGAFAVSGRQCKDTLINCYYNDWTILIVSASYLLGRAGAFPIIVEVGRTRLIQLFFGQVTNRVVLIFNILFMIIATVICILSPILPISTLMNIVGSVITYFLIYLIPTWLHFGCLYPKDKTDEQLLQDSQNSIISESKQDEDEVSLKDDKFCKHEADYVHKRSKITRYIIYGIYNVIGIAIGIYGLYQTIKQIASQ